MHASSWFSSYCLLPSLHRLDPYPHGDRIQQVVFPTCCASSTSSMKDCQAPENQTVIPVQGTKPLWTMQMGYSGITTPLTKKLVSSLIQYLPNKHHHCWNQILDVVQLSTFGVFHIQRGQVSGRQGQHKKYGLGYTVMLKVPQQRQPYLCWHLFHVFHLSAISIN
jgi:hypothetical protein